MAGTSSFRRREKKFSKKMQRSLDPAMLLSRGLSARFVGANVMQSIAPLNKDEMEKDLRHMNAYYQANVAYAQQHYIYMNREELAAQGQLPGAIGAAADNRAQNLAMVPPMAMPVRIDPEEEKRLQNLRKKIAICETQREFLESQYVSLRAHYVATTKELAAASKHSEGLVLFLQNVTKRRGKVLALQRARLQIARDVLACLKTRMEGLQAAAQQETTATVGTGNGEAKIAIVPKDEATKMDVDSPYKASTGSNAISAATASVTDPKKEEDDIVQVWSELEESLKEAELACRKIPSTLTINEKKSKKKSKKASAEQDEENMGILPWDALKLPNTPQDVPIYISQLALVPEKGAAFGTSGVFGSRKASMSWMESSMPACYDAKEEELKVSKLREEADFLENELTRERDANRDIQIGIIDRRKRSDELVAMMTLLRSETEAILQRHNILLDSPQAKQAAKELHEEVVKERAAKGESAPADRDTSAEKEANGDASGEKPSENGASKKVGDKPKTPKDDDENDGDDEGDDDDEEGEIVEGGNKGEWGDRGSKRDLDDDEEGLVDETVSAGRNKRRKL